MLPKYPYTPEGVKSKLAEIYALDDTNLRLQANAVKNETRDWISDNFLLDTVQETYLTNLDDREIEWMGSQLYFCFIYRQDVVMLQKPSAPGLNKNTSTQSAFTTIANDSGRFEIDGTFVIKSFYE